VDSELFDEELQQQFIDALKIALVNNGASKSVSIVSTKIVLATEGGVDVTAEIIFPFEQDNADEVTNKVFAILKETLSTVFPTNKFGTIILRSTKKVSIVYNPKPGITVKTLQMIETADSIAVGFVLTGGHRQLYRTVDVPLSDCQAAEGGCTKGVAVSLAWSSLEGWAKPYLEEMSTKSPYPDAAEIKSMGLKPPAGISFNYIHMYMHIQDDRYTGYISVLHSATGEEGFFSPQ
jgi:hypothetical protein